MRNAWDWCHIKCHLAVWVSMKLKNIKHFNDSKSFLVEWLRIIWKKFNCGNSVLCTYIRVLIVMINFNRMGTICFIVMGKDFSPLLGYCVKKYRFHFSAYLFCYSCKRNSATIEQVFSIQSKWQLLLRSINYSTFSIPHNGRF